MSKQPKQIKEGTNGKKATLSLDESRNHQQTHALVEAKIAERIEPKEKLERRSSFDRILTSTAVNFINLPVDEVDDAINNALGDVAVFLQIDQACIYMLNENGRFLQTTHSWPQTNHPSPSPSRDFGNLPASLLKKWLPCLRQQELLYIENLADVEAETQSEQTFLAMQGSKSALIIPLISGPETVGFLGLYSCQLDPAWHTENLDAIKMAGTIFTNALLRHRDEAKLVKEPTCHTTEPKKHEAQQNETNLKLAKALRAKDEFLANMSHELRTPLNAILGKSEILLEEIYGPLTEKQAASLKVIDESGQHLLELINDILDISKIEAGKIQLNIQKVSLANVCESSLQFVRQMAHKKQIRLHANIDHSLKTSQLDERRLKQILINLLSNAIKFTPAGGEVGLNVLHNPEEDIVQFQVWDTGIGIPPEGMQKLFQPFMQLDNSLARPYEGSGLGLSLVYQLVEMHGGGISLESQPGVGSCFTVSLPKNPTPDLAQLKKEAQTDLQELAPAGEPLIVLVEENESYIEMITGYLPILGYRLTVVRNGSEALQRIRTKRPDLILINVQISQMDWVTAVRQLRSEKIFKNTPVVALAALSMEGDRERCLAAGANEYLSKPFQLRQLATIIHDLLARQKTKVEEPDYV